MLAALVRRDGGKPTVPPILPDTEDAIRQGLRTALRQADVVLLSGGSSVGLEDHAPRIVAGEGELPVHGVALRPAAPAGVGFVGGVPVFLMPGNPVSCLCAYDLFAGRAVRRLGGLSPELPYRTRTLPLAKALPSAVGRVDYVRVLVRGEQVEPLATGGASVLSSTTRADGFVLLPHEVEAIPPGQSVTVYLYD
jgi:molybdopterin molybdotransferase